MRLVVLAQEEPVYMAPMLIRLLEAKRKDISFLAIGNLRGAAAPPRSFVDGLRRLCVYWLILEPYGFCRALFRRFTFFLFRSAPLLFGDMCSVERAARRLRIPVMRFPQVDELIAKLEQAQPDVILNQTDIILDSRLLAIPKLGVVNRHGSLLPLYRGRVASFWSHYYGKAYGVTVHFVSREIDAGPVIWQRPIKVSPVLSYDRVLRIMFNESLIALLKALFLLEDNDFKPKHMAFEGTRVYGFPTVKDALNYRAIMSRRRRHAPI